MSASSAELLRYQRQMILPEIGVMGQEKLKRGRVLVVGAGGLGCPVLTYLAAAGVGSIKIVDADVVDITNLHRQPLYSESAVGRLKAEEAARVLQKNNSSIKLAGIPLRLEPANVCELLGDVDVVVDGSDNFATKYLLNDACVELNKPLVSASVFCFEGQLSVFNAAFPDGTRGPTYRCLFPEPPPAALVPSCADAGVLGILPGMMGTLQATETLKLILGIGQLLTGRLLILDALSLSFSEITFQRNEILAARTVIDSPSYYRGLSAPCSMKTPIITPKELRQKLQSREEIVMIDVREPAEKAEFDIGGELIPSGTLLLHAHRIPRDQMVVLYCRSGVRSQKGVAELQRECGYTNLVSLEGGMLAWQSEHL